MNYVARKGLLPIIAIVSFLAISFSHLGVASTYTIQDIKVDVTAETAVDAREQALKQAQIAAFKKLLNSIVLKEDQSKLPEIEEDQIESYIKTYSVSDEKLTGTRYLATYKFSLLKDQVNSFLGNQGITPLAFEQKKILIIPIHSNNDETSIGDGIWHDNWAAAVADHKGTYTMPLVDIEDQFKIKTFIDKADAEGLKELLQKYGSDSLAVMWLKTAPEDDHLYEVQIHELDDQHSIPNVYKTPAFWLPEEGDFMQGKIKELIEDFQEKEKYKTIDKKSYERKVTVEIPCSDIDCVNMSKNDLYSIKNIKNITMTEVNNKKVIYSIVYEGKFKALQQKLESKNYNVSFTDTGVLIQKIA